MSHISTRAGLRLVVLAGGESAERPVSLCSGEQVTRALGSAGHLVTPIDPAETPVDFIPWNQYDACFLALHGGAGENGQIQRQLEARGVPFTGSGSRASRLAMVKSASKERFFHVGVPTPSYVLLERADSDAEVAGKTAGMRLPLVVKPDAQGSSLGLALARNSGELRAAARGALEYDSRALVEPYIMGREFTVAVLGRQALPLLEVVSAGTLFDYEAKYESAMTEHRFETGLIPETAAEIEQCAVAAAEALGTSGLVRVDVMLDKLARPWVLEVNTIPGMTAHSLAPKAAARAGMSLAELCEWMLEDCLAASEVTR